MFNINGFGKTGSISPAGHGRMSGNNGKPSKTEKKEKNTDKAEFSAFSMTVKTEIVKTEIRVGKTSAKTNGLSEKAQNYLEKLKNKYGNMDFIIADYSTDEEADKLLAKGKGEYNVLITPDLLEKMAADESTAAEYEAKLEKSVDNIKAVEEGLGDDADLIDKIGITIDSDGNVSLRAKLLEGMLTRDGSNTVKASTADDMLAQLKEAKEANADKLEEIRKKRAENAKQNAGMAVIDTDDVDREIKTLKAERLDISVQIRTEHNADRKSELEMMLRQLDSELSRKDSEEYRKCHSHHFVANA